MTRLVPGPFWVRDMVVQRNAMELSRMLKRAIVIGALVLSSAVILLLVLKLSVFTQRSEVELMKRELNSLINYWVRAGPLRDHLVERYEDFLAAVRGQKTLNSPFIVCCFVSSGGEYEDKERVCLVLKWFETGFDSAGVKISFEGETGSETRYVGFPAWMWDEENQKHYEETLLRDFSLPGWIEGEKFRFLLWAASRSGSEREVLELPVSMLSGPTTVTIYDGEGKEGFPAELETSDEVRALVNPRIDTEENVPSE